MPWSISDLSFLMRASEAGASPRVLGAHHAPAVLGGDGLGVVTNDLVELLAGAHRGRTRPTKRREHALEPGQDALEQQLLLVGDVVVDRGLGDVQRRRDLVDGGVVIAALIERAGRGPDHRLALDVAGSLARIADRPRGGVRRRRFDCHNLVARRLHHRSPANAGCEAPLQYPTLQ